MFAHDDTYTPLTHHRACLEELNEILLDYQTQLGSNPQQLRHAIPTDEMWRFFVDGCDQSRCWLPVEARENGYFKAMFTAFNEIFSHTAELNQAFILKLHQLCMTDVKNTNYVNPFGENSPPGEYRSANLHGHGCFFESKDVTLAGLQERFARPSHRYDGLMVEYNDFGTRCKVIFISQKTIAALRKYKDQLTDTHQVNNQTFVKIIKQFADTDFIKYIDNEQHADDELTRLTCKLFYRLSQTTQSEDMAECLQFAITSREYADNQFSFMSFSLQSEKIPTAEIAAEMQHLINKYQRSIRKAKLPLEKLGVIVQFIQSCERLHPFYDGNGRTFCTLLINFLLIKNGFPLVIMDNPNHFDTYSCPELVREVIKGMRTVLMLQNPCPLYGIFTEDENEKIARQSPLLVTLFNSWSAIEQANRDCIHGTLDKTIMPTI